MLLSRGSSRRLGCYRARGAPEGGIGADAEALADAAGQGRGGRGGGVEGRGRRRVAQVREGIDALQLVLDGAGQAEGIQSGSLTSQRSGDVLGDLRAREHAVERRLGGVVSATDASADPLFALELDGGQEEILEQPQLAAVEGLDGRLRRRAVVAYVAQQLADVRPVLLLDVGVVVLLVRAPAGELDLLGLAVVPQMLIDEFRAVVRVDPSEPEGQGLAER